MDDDKIYFYSASTQLGRIQSAYEKIEQRYNYLSQRLEELENVQQDLLHYIEFADLDIQKGFKIYKKLQRCRIERRVVKDELEGMTIAKESIKAIKEGMYQIRKGQGQTAKLEFSTNRRYTPRASLETQLEDFEDVQNYYNEKLDRIVEVKKWTEGEIMMEKITFKSEVKRQAPFVIAFTAGYISSTLNIAGSFVVAIVAAISIIYIERKKK